MPAAAARAGAQPPPPGESAALDAARAVRGESLEVRLLTFANGEALWERFGHDAIAIRDRATGEDVSYNWGMFDFGQPNFLARFLTGETRYWMAPIETGRMIAGYRAEERTVREQVLALTAVERAALLDFVRWNAAGEQRFYRYDYYRDNCATRVRDALDRVLGGRLRAALLRVLPSRTTWREETARVTDGDWPPFVGIHLALGRAADEPLDTWEETFMPGRLADAVAQAEIVGPDGDTRPLVAEERVLYRAARDPLPPTPPSRLLPAALLALLLAAAVTALGAAYRSGAWGARTALRIAAVTWYAIGGVTGTLLLLAGTVTFHAPYMGHNLSLWLVHPLLLVLAVAAAAGGGTGRLARLATHLSALVAVLALLGAALQATFLPQQSWLVTVPAVALHVAFAVALRAPPPVGPTPIATSSAAAA